MFQSMHTIKTSMLTNQKNIDIISNNIANMNNDGYKKKTLDFKEILYEQYDKKYLDTDNTTYQIGHGVSGTESRNYKEGALVATENSLDLAINEEGFFQLGDGEDDNFVTRGGSFKTEELLGTKYITTQDGYYLLDQNGDMITFTGDEDKIRINQIGEVFDEQGVQIATLGFVGIENKETLRLAQNNIYQMTDETRFIEDEELGQICQYTKEKSNVDLSEEMTNLIKAQRMYQVSSRVMQAVDDMHSKANQLRR